VVEIRAPGSGEDALRAVAQFVAGLNRRAEHHIGYLGDTVESVTSELRELWRPAHEVTLAAFDDARLAGAFALDADEEVGRSWLLGPFVEHDDWEVVADRLFDALLPLVPAAAREAELFCNSANQRCVAFAGRHGFTSYKDALIMQLDRVDWHSEPAASLGSPPPHWHAELVALHEATFPNTYYTGSQLLGRVAASPDRRLFAVGDASGLCGYLYAERSPELGEASLEFVGVAPRARRRGSGRQLVCAMLAWAFASPSVEQVHLTVEPGNHAAVHLYEQLGFRRLQEMRSFRTRV
jgi:ribosomal protein S18 acetylase RimI-like enzyme